MISQLEFYQLQLRYFPQSQSDFLSCFFCRLGKVSETSDVNVCCLTFVCVYLAHSCPCQVKSAASYALGSIAVGNLPEYLPFVLQEISSSKRQYLLLHSLKEIISKT